MQSNSVHNSKTKVTQRRRSSWSIIVIESDKFFVFSQQIAFLRGNNCLQKQTQTIFFSKQVATCISSTAALSSSLSSSYFSVFCDFSPSFVFQLNCKQQSDNAEHLSDWDTGQQKLIEEKRWTISLIPQWNSRTCTTQQWIPENYTITAFIISLAQGGTVVIYHWITRLLHSSSSTEWCPLSSQSISLPLSPSKDVI